jgi:cell division septation protein DedD
MSWEKSWFLLRKSGILRIKQVLHIRKIHKVGRKQMEQQKVLWIIIAVGIVIVLILGVAFLVFNKQLSGAAAPVVSPNPQVSPLVGTEYFKSPDRDNQPGGSSVTNPNGDTIVVVGDTGNVQQNNSSPNNIQNPPANNSVNQTNQGNTANNNQTATASPSATPIASVKPSVSPKPGKQAAGKKPEKQPVKAAGKYWVQAGSFESSARAEEVKRELAAKGFSPVIYTRSENSKTFYRVRIGPYVKKSEAEGFLKWVKTLKGFESSFISE